MKRTMIKWLMALVVLGMMMTQSSWAAFRVKMPSATIRHQALMAAQSAGTAEDETVETTTKDNPFTVDFSSLGVENPTNAYLLIVNQQTGNAISLYTSRETDTSLRLSPLVLAELEMQYLGASQSYCCMAMYSTSEGKDNALSSRRIASCIGSVELPNFYYRAENGEVKLTNIQDRRLVAFVEDSPNFIMLDPNDESQRILSQSLSEKFSYNSIVYSLPDGRNVVYGDAGEVMSRLIGNNVNSEKSDFRVFTSSAMATQSTEPNNLAFDVTVSIPDKSTTLATVKDATSLGLRKWSEALAGSVPVSISITMCSFYNAFKDEGDQIDYSHVIGMSISPSMVFDSGNHLTFVESLGQQIAGYNFSEDSDITLCMNTDMAFYYGIDGNCPNDKVDYATIILHEVAHGLGFMDSLEYYGSGDFTYSDGEYWYPMIFDYLLTYGGTSICSLSKSDRYKAIRSGSLYFGGSNAKAANGGSAIKMYAPTKYAPGSSVSHWDDSVSFQTFMKYQYHYPLHTIGAQKLGLMQDIGWTIASVAPTKPDVPTGVSATKGTIIGEVEVTWNMVNGATSYTVYRSESASGSYAEVKSGLTTCKYPDKDIVGTTRYYYKVEAVNSAGASAKSNYDYGYSKAATTLSSIKISGAATLTAGEYADYKCTAYYSDDSTKDVTLDSGCAWTLPYGGAYAKLKGNRLTAGALTEKKTATIRVEFGDKLDELTVTILPKTVTVTFDSGSCGTASFTSKAYTVDAKYNPLPTISNVSHGKKFTGWFTAASGGNEITTDTTVSGAISKLYAHYVDVPVAVSVRLDAPTTLEWGRSYTPKCYVTYSGSLSEVEITSGASWSTQNNGMTVSFRNSWPTISASEGSTGSATIAVIVDAIKSTSYTIKAVAPTATITLDPNGGTVSPTTITVQRGTSFAYIPSPSWSDHEFKGWFTSKDGGVQIQNGSTYDGTYTKLYARWEKIVVLSSVSISGADAVVSGATSDYACTAHFSDGTTMENVAAEWSASAGEIVDGKFKAPGVTASTEVTITASYTSKDITKSAIRRVSVTPKTVRVAFFAQGGMVGEASRTFTVGLAYGDLPVPEWDKYHAFDGWFTTAGDGGQHVTADTRVREEVATLYAHWHTEVLLEHLSISGSSVVTAGETIMLVCQAHYSDGTSKQVVPTWSVVRGGEWIDANWKTKFVAENEPVMFKAEYGGISMTHGVTIMPKKVVVTFDANGGTPSEATHEYIVGAKYNTLPGAEYSAHRFLGWYTSLSGGTRILETTDVAEGVTALHAHWQENPPSLKEITLTAAKTALTSGETMPITCTATYTNGVTTTTDVLNGSDIEWSINNVEAGAVENGVFAALRVTEAATVVVTGVYQAQSATLTFYVEPEILEVIFNANGGTVSPASREFVVGAKYGDLPVPIYDENHKFDGWFTSVTEGMRVAETTICEKPVTTLYAHWTEVTRLTALRIVGDNVVTSSVPETYVCYGVYSDNSEIVVTPEWSLADGKLGVIDEEGLFTSAYVPEVTNAVVRAIYGSVTGEVVVTVMPFETSVRFDPCNGAVTPQRMTFVVGAAYGELPTPVRSRYDFAGWYTGGSKSGSLVTAESIVSEEVETLYAGWTPTPTALTGIKIEGVETVTSGGMAVFSCEAVYADGTMGSVVPVWSIVKGLDYATLTLSGFFTAQDVETPQKVTVQAVYTDKGIRYEDQHVVTITPATLVVDPASMSLESGAQSKSILVDSFGSWTVRTDAEWITLDKTSGAYVDAVDFSVPANTGTEERIGTIYVTGDGMTATCVVKQYSPVPDEYVMVTLDTKIPGQASSQRQYVKGRKFGYLPTPVRTGYAFGGWWTSPNGAGSRVHAMTVVSDDTMTLYGYWTDVSVAYALNNALDWVEDAVHPWAFDYADAMDRKVAMTTPILGNRQSSSLTVLVEGPGSISFYWKTSSEEFFDALALYVDGKFVSAISGETGWQSLSKTIAGYGQHVVTWTYAKDGQGAGGMDCAWLDMVTWSPDYARNGATSIQSADGRAVPETWLNSYGLDTRTTSLDDDVDGDGMTNYEEYIAGTDPLDPESKFQIYIEMNADGTPQIGAIPDLGDSATRTYILEGKENLSDEEWSPADDTIHHFFRVRIEVH